MNLTLGTPLKTQFAFSGTQLNAAFMHPVSNPSIQAQQAYLNVRRMNAAAQQVDMMADREQSKALFAKLIGADSDELAWISSTMVGENLVLASLGIDKKRRIVTDAYHFSGSLHLYLQLQKQGFDIKVVLPRNNRIELDDIAAAIVPGTCLVALSLVSAINGFQHDLAAVCDIAHAEGALVYADIVQAAGNMPINVHASGVDFCACSTYKWLMGDFGAGFLYVRRDRLKLLQRSQQGYRQLAAFNSHLFPFDPPGEEPFASSAREDVAGYFEVGTLSNGAISALRPSLEWLLELGPQNIELHRQPLLQRLQSAFLERGYQPMTPPDSQSALVTFACQDTSALASRLNEANIHVSTYRHRVRVSPSFYNDMDDIERLIEVL